MVNTPKKERSHAYPVMALADALTRISNINENLGLQGRYNRETIATGMGYSGLSGTSARAVAALAQYGLLDREKDQYSLSRLAKNTLHPLKIMTSLLQCAQRHFHRPSLQKFIKLSKGK
jgi:hypothetical protein